jgi:hypothetical protein
MEIILYTVSLICSISKNTKDKHENSSYFLQQLTHKTAFKLRYKYSIYVLAT